MEFSLNIRKIKGFVFRHRVSAIIIVIAVLVAVGACWYLLGKNVVYKAPAFNLKKPVETRVEAPLTGELVDPALANRRALAVVIENHPDARPQSGYNDADVVFETLAEGGITRTLAVFQSKDAKEIGPVRSARSYFVEWAKEYNAVFAHVGGNADAIDLLKKNGTADLNQFYNGSYFWRSSDRYAPHNVYTTTEKLYAAAAANKYDTTGAPKAFKFKKEVEKAARPQTQVVKVGFSYDLFEAEFTYNAETNSYLRSIAGVAAKDKNTRVQVSPKNVIVMLTSIVPYVNYVNEQGVRINTTGGGKAIIFQDGTSNVGTWSKDTASSQTVFKGADGKEIELNRGQTWIAIAPLGATVSY